MEHKVPIPEHKWYDTIPTGLAVPNVPFILALDGIPQGVGQSNRIGDSVKASSLFYRFSLTKGLTDSIVRVIWFIWKSNDIPAASDILQNSGTTTSYISPLNRDRGMNIRVLHDRLYTLGAGETQLQVEKQTKRLWFTNKYDSDSTTTTSMNGLYLLITSNASATNAPTFDGYVRLSYTDS